LPFQNRQRHIAVTVRIVLVVQGSWLLSLASDVASYKQLLLSENVSVAVSICLPVAWLVSC